jgi:hypothetical protein
MEGTFQKVTYCYQCDPIKRQLTKRFGNCDIGQNGDEGDDDDRRTEVVDHPAEADLLSGRRVVEAE